MTVDDDPRRAPDPSLDAHMSDSRDLTVDSPPSTDLWPAPGTPASGRPALVAATVRHAGSPWLLLAVWVATRAMMLHEWSSKYQYITGDPHYYFWALRFTPSIAERLREYPVPVVAFLEIFRWPAADVASTYILAFAIGMALLDAAFTVVLWRAGARAGAWYWMVFGFFMGPLLWFRFDVLPAVIVGVALLWVQRRPTRSGVFIGLGAAIKLWPALLLLPLVHRGPAGRRRVQGMLVTGGLLALISWAFVGWARLVSPLTWQGNRGLQIESIPASAAMFEKAFGPSIRWHIDFSKYNAYEITGPGVSTALHVSTVLMALVIVVAAAFAVVGWHSSDRPGHRLTAFDFTLAAVALIALLIVANKTFSPQYMFWMGAPLAVLIHHAGRRSGPRPSQSVQTQRRLAAWFAGVGLAAAALTQVVFPDNYNDLIFVTPSNPVITTDLLLRNLLMVVLAGSATAVALVRYVRSARA